MRAISRRGHDVIFGRKKSKDAELDESAVDEETLDELEDDDEDEAVVADDEAADRRKTADVGEKA